LRSVSSGGLPRSQNDARFALRIAECERLNVAQVIRLQLLDNANICVNSGTALNIGFSGGGWRRL
jgi:hypothetical protein